MAKRSSTRAQRQQSRRRSRSGSSSTTPPRRPRGGGGGSPPPEPPDDGPDPSIDPSRRAVYREALLEIKRNSPDNLLHVEAAVNIAESDPNCVLREQLEFDDSVAGHKYRIIQMRQLIRCVLLTDDTGDKTPVFVSLRVDRQRPGGGYREMLDVVSDAELLNELQADARRDLYSLLSRYNMLQSWVVPVAHAGGVQPPPAPMQRSEAGH